MVAYQFPPLGFLCLTPITTQPSENCHTISVPLSNNGTGQPTDKPRHTRTAAFLVSGAERSTTVYSTVRTSAITQPPHDDVNTEGCLVGGGAADNIRHESGISRLLTIFEVLASHPLERWIASSQGTQPFFPMPRIRGQSHSPYHQIRCAVSRIDAT